MHLNRLEINLGSFSASIAMPREEWKRKRQKQPIQHPKQGREHLPGPSKETPNLAAGWDIVVQYATNLWSIPEAHSVDSHTYSGVQSPNSPGQRAGLTYWMNRWEHRIQKHMSHQSQQ